MQAVTDRVNDREDMKCIEACFQREKQREEATRKRKSWEFAKPQEKGTSDSGNLNVSKQYIHWIFVLLIQY